jgi:transposase
LPNKPRGVPRVDDRRVISAMVHVIRGGLMWRDAPAAYGPHKTLYNRFIRWSRIGVFDQIFATLAAESAATDTVMIPSRRLLCNSLPSQRLSRRRDRLARAAGRRNPDRRQGRRGATGSATPSPNWTSRPAFQGARTAGRRPPTTPKSTSSAIWSSACSEGLRTGAGSPRALTAAPTRS